MVLSFLCYGFPRLPSLYHLISNKSIHSSAIDLVFRQGRGQGMPAMMSRHQMNSSFIEYLVKDVFLRYAVSYRCRCHLWSHEISNQIKQFKGPFRDVEGIFRTHSDTEGRVKFRNIKENLVCLLNICTQTVLGNFPICSSLQGRQKESEVNSVNLLYMDDQLLIVVMEIISFVELFELFSLQLQLDSCNYYQIIRKAGVAPKQFLVIPSKS